MKYLSRVGVALSAFAGIVSFAAAGGPILGVWHGHVTVDASKLPPIADPAQKQRMLTQVKAAAQIKITLTLKADKTFSITSVGGPRPQPPASGTYTSTATTVTIHPAVQGRIISQTFNISKDGKSLSLASGPALVTFVR